MNQMNPPAPGPNEPPPPYTEAVPSPTQPRSHSHSHPPSSTLEVPPQPRNRAASDTANAPQTPTVPTSITNTNPLKAHPIVLPVPTQKQQQQPQRRSRSASTSKSSTTKARAPKSSQPFSYPIEVKPNSLPSDLFYPEDWAPARDVRAEDWDTFVGCLLPTGGRITKDATSLAPERRRAVEATIADWNDGFFRRRGVKIYLDDEASTSAPALPPRPAQDVSWNEVSWTDSPASTRRSSAAAGPSAGVTSQPTSSYPSPAPASAQAAPVMSNHQAPQPPPTSTRDRLTRKLKEKDVSWTSDSVRVGDTLKAGPDGLKIGSLTLDEKGVKYGAKFVADSNSVRSFLGGGQHSQNHYQNQYLPPPDPENLHAAYGPQSSNYTYEPPAPGRSSRPSSQLPYGTRAPSPRSARTSYVEPSQQQPRSHAFGSAWRRPSVGRMPQEYVPPSGPPPEHIMQESGIVGRAQ